MSLFDTFSGLVTRLIRGNAALTTQEFNEAHVKNGRLMHTTLRPADIVASGSFDVVLRTPVDRAVLVKARNVQTDASEMRINVYSGPTYTAGSAISIYGTNGNIVYPSTCTVLSAPTVTATGTQIAPTAYIIGTTAQGQSQRVGFNAASGFQRYLVPNTAYLLRCTNVGSFTARTAIELVWFESPISEYPVV